MSIDDIRDQGVPKPKPKLELEILENPVGVESVVRAVVGGDSSAALVLDESEGPSRVPGDSPTVVSRLRPRVREVVVEDFEIEEEELVEDFEIEEEELVEDFEIEEGAILVAIGNREEIEIGDDEIEVLAGEDVDLDGLEGDADEDPQEQDTSRGPPPVPRAALSPPMPHQTEISEQHRDQGSGGVGAVVPVLILETPASESVVDKLIASRRGRSVKRRAEILLEDIESARDSEHAAQLCYQLGELCEQELKNEASAVKAYGRALEADPTFRANLWAIRRVFYKRKLWPNLLKLIGAELRLPNLDAHRIDLHLERGNILLHRIGDLGAARRSFQSALALDASNQISLLALESIADRLGDFELLHSVLTQLAATSKSPQRKAAILVELARELRLADTGLNRAHELLLQASALNCLHETVDAEREALARHCKDLDALVGCIEGRVARLQEYLEAARQAEDSQAEDSHSNACATDDVRVREIVALRREQAQLLSQGDKLEAAWSCLQDALSLCPHESLLLSDLAVLAEQMGRYEDLAELVSARDNGALSVERSVALAIKRAGALQRAGKQVEAEQVLTSAARTAPGYLPLIAAREVAVTKGAASWGQLARLQAELADSALRGTAFGADEACEPSRTVAAEHCVVSGDLLRFCVLDDEAAKGRYAQALQLDRQCDSAVDAMVSLYMSTGRLDQAAHLLEDVVGPAGSDARDRSLPGHERRLSLLSQLAALYLTLGLGEQELAVLDAMGAEDSKDGTVRSRRIALLRECGAYEKLCAALLAEVNLSQDTDTRAEMLFDAGRIFEAKLGRPEDAARCFSQCRQYWPEDPILRLLERNTLRSLGDWTGLLLSIEAEIERCDDESEVSALGREALAILEFDLEDPARACRLAETLCERVPTDVGILLDALGCMERFSGEQAKATRIVDVLELLLSVSEGALRLAVLMRLAHVSWGLGRTADARAAFEEAAERGVGVAAALALQQVNAEENSQTFPGTAMLQVAQCIPQGALQSSVLSLAAWHQLLSGETDAALAMLEKLQEDDGDFGAGRWALSLLHASQGEIQSQGKLLVALSSEEGDVYEQSSLLLHAAALSDVSGSPGESVERLRAARSVSPQDVGVAVMLADHLEPLCPDGSDTVPQLLDRAEICEMRAVLAEPGCARWGWEMERAEALEAAGHLKRSVSVLSSVLRKKPESVRALEILRRVCQRGGDLESQARACVALAQLSDSAERSLSRLREAVAIFDGETGSVSMAVATYLAILEQDPGAPEYERTVVLLEEHKDPRLLYRVYTGRLSHLDRVGAPLESTSILLARARLRSEFGDVAGGCHDLGKLLFIDATSYDALVLRSSLLLRSGDGRGAVEHLESVLSLQIDEDRRLSAEIRIAEIVGDALGDPSEAIERLFRVVRKHPTHLLAREGLLRLLLAEQRMDEASLLLAEMDSPGGAGDV